MSDSRPIGVFDSGIGGLTVLKEIWNRLPNESTVYFGDNGRAPYGTKSHDTIVKYSLQNLHFLESKNVKMIVIACNTASAHAFEKVSEIAKVPVVEVVYPGAEAASRATKNGKIGIIATKATVSSDVYKLAVENCSARLISEGVNVDCLSKLEVYQQACPLFVSLAEEGWWDKEVTRLTAIEYLTPLKEAGVDTLVLACTHYPLLADVIGEVMGDNVILINAGKSVANVVAQKLASNDSQAPEGSKAVTDFFTSDNPEVFENVASPFLGGGRPAGTRHVEEQ